MESFTVVGKKREQTGKGAARKIRKQGMIPGVVYKETTSIPVVVDPRQIERILRSPSGENTIFQFTVEGEEQRERKVIIRDLQYDPVKDALLHVDLYEISMDEEITVRVPLELVGEPVGVTRGGSLSHLLWELEIECLPDRIPPKIEVDVSQLDMGDVLTIADLSIPEGIRVLHDPEDPVATVSVAAAEEEEVEEAAPEEAGQAEEREESEES
ncbi:MAG: 50S ribosomal protein L25/general stress protein Ctc [Nitrospinota bacterium]|nr:MAG: 50S ribosomal protein L25/general stress protein Ctc [Nitrospinota bacterium]